MEIKKIRKALEALRGTFNGDLYTNDLWRIMYATDASAYREIPLELPVRVVQKTLRSLSPFAENIQSL